MIEHFDIFCGHCLIDGNIRICIGCDGNKIENMWNFNHECCISSIINHKYPFIKHFRTYSLKEYCEQKLQIKHFCGIGDIRRRLPSLYYFRINTRTPEKDEFIRNWRKEHSQNYLFICSENTFANNHWLKECFCYVFGKPLGTIEMMKQNIRFQGISSLKEIINDMDYVVFL